LLGEFEANQSETVVLADMEAGLGTMSRMQEGHVDYVLVITEPSWKAIEVAQRAVEMVRERGVGQILVIANRIANEQSLEQVRQALPDLEIIPIPDDTAIRTADRDAVAPIDLAPDSPGVLAFTQVVNRLLQAAPS
jgi:CO dehydrogenase maturation factor